MNDGIKLSIFGGSIAFASGTDWKVVACLCATAIALSLVEYACVRCRCGLSVGETVIDTERQ